VRVVLCLAVVGCQQSAPSITPPVDNKAPQPAVISHAPFVINNRIVAEDGHVIRELGRSTGMIAVPDGPHRFVLGDDVIDTAANTVTKLVRPVSFDTADGSRHRLVRREPDGKERWTVGLAGVRTVRPPDVAFGHGVVAVTVDSEIDGYDDATGHMVWHLEHWGSRMHVAGDTLLSIDCNEPTDDHFLIGYDVGNGVERFRAPLVKGCDPTLAVTPSGDRVLVVEERPAETRLYDIRGHELAKLGEVASGGATTCGAERSRFPPAPAITISCSSRTSTSSGSIRRGTCAGRSPRRRTRSSRGTTSCCFRTATS
jgi:putative pyrroloquinoline-quinone binding quinoprotein